MFKKTFFKSEPLFFQLIYSITFLGFLYVMYEVIFLDYIDQTKHLKGVILILFGIFNIRMVRNQIKK